MQKDISIGIDSLKVTQSQWQMQKQIWSLHIGSHQCQITNLLPQLSKFEANTAQTPTHLEVLPWLRTAPYSTGPTSISFQMWVKAVHGLVYSQLNWSQWSSFSVGESLRSWGYTMQPATFRFSGPSGKVKRCLKRGASKTGTVQTEHWQQVTNSTAFSVSVIPSFWRKQNASYAPSIIESSLWGMFVTRQWTDIMRTNTGKAPKVMY